MQTWYYDLNNLITLFGLVREKFHPYREWQGILTPYHRGQNDEFHKFCKTFGGMFAHEKNTVELVIWSALPPSTNRNGFDDAPANRRLRALATAAALTAGFIDDAHLPIPLPGSAERQAA